MSRSRVAVASVFLLLVSLGPLPVAAQDRPDYVIVDPAEGFEPLAGSDTFAGTLDVDGADSAYRIEVPEDWNGTLVLYAHGFVGPQIPELVVQNPPLRELFIDQGFAWAASSYSANGYVIDAAVEETDALREQFAELTGLTAPAATIVHGVSMGGHITGVAIERRPDAYVGALPACGAMGDVELFDYFTDVNLVAGALAGVEVPFPADLSFLEGPAQQITAELELLEGLSTPEGVQYADVVEAVSGGERPTFEQSLEFWNVAAAIDLGEGPPVPFLQGLYAGALSEGIDDPAGVEDSYDNSDTIYGFPNGTSAEPSPQEQLINAAVDRYEGGATPPFPIIEGTPQMPVLSIHTTGDLFVPLRQQLIYAEEVATNGLADNLVQRTVRSPGHCDFTGEELGGAFLELVGWITSGTRPTGEDLLDPAVVTDRDLGCAFTSETREGMPECDDPTALLVGGEDPVATSVAVSSARAASPTAVIARADVFADGFTGSALAGVSDAPLLLNPMEALDPRILAELQRLGVTDVALLGGTAALSADVEQGLTDAGLAVNRLAGSNRFATAGAIAQAITAATGAQTEVFLAYGGGFADSVAVAGLAAFLERPILLTETDRLPVETQQTLSALGDPATRVVGGAAVVGDEVAGDSLRIAGDNRYGTSEAAVDVSRNAGLRINEPWLVSGETFADALVAGPAAAAAGQIMVMVDGDDLAGSAGSTNQTLEGLAGVVDDLVVVRTGQAIADGTVPTLESAVTHGAAVVPDAGLVTIDVEGTSDEVVQTIRERIEQAPPMLMAEVDHDANASSVGLDLPATELLILGAPPVGTPLMQSARTVAIDLPQKILVWSDEAGTHVTYTHPQYLAARHGLSEVDDQLEMIAGLLAQLAGTEPPLPPPSTVGIGAGLTTVPVEGDVDTVVADIQGRIDASPATLVATVDHQANAESAGLELDPTTLLIFGAPPVGTPLMQSVRTVGIDLPQKMLVWSDESGAHVTYNRPGYLAARHGLTGVDAQLDMIGMLLPTLATGPAG